MVRIELVTCASAGCTAARQVAPLGSCHKPARRAAWGAEAATASSWNASCCSSGACQEGREKDADVSNT